MLWCSIDILCLIKCSHTSFSGHNDSALNQYRVMFTKWLSPKLFTPTYTSWHFIQWIAFVPLISPSFPPLFFSFSLSLLCFFLFSCILTLFSSVQLSINFYLSIVDSQCFVHCWVQQSDSAIYRCILFRILFHHSLLRDIE